MFLIKKLFALIVYNCEKFFSTTAAHYNIDDYTQKLQPVILQLMTVARLPALFKTDYLLKNTPDHQFFSPQTEFDEVVAFHDKQTFYVSEYINHKILCKFVFIVFC